MINKVHPGFRAGSGQPGEACWEKGIVHGCTRLHADQKFWIGAWISVMKLIAWGGRLMNNRPRLKTNSPIPLKKSRASVYNLGIFGQEPLREPSSFTLKPLLMSFLDDPRPAATGRDSPAFLLPASLPCNHNQRRSMD